MRFSIAAAVLALTGFTNAYTTPVGANPSGNPIFKPGLSEIVPVGKPYTITWNVRIPPNSSALSKPRH